MQYLCIIKSTVFLIIYLIYNSLYKYYIDLHLTTDTKIVNLPIPTYQVIHNFHFFIHYYNGCAVVVKEKKKKKKKKL